MFSRQPVGSEKRIVSDVPARLAAAVPVYGRDLAGPAGPKPRAGLGRAGPRAEPYLPRERGSDWNATHEETPDILSEQTDDRRDTLYNSVPGGLELWRKRTTCGRAGRGTRRREEKGEGMGARVGQRLETAHVRRNVIDHCPSCATSSQRVVWSVVGRLVATVGRPSGWTVGCPSSSRSVVWMDRLVACLDGWFVV